MCRHIKGCSEIYYDVPGEEMENIIKLETELQEIRDRKNENQNDTAAETLFKELIPLRKKYSLSKKSNREIIQKRKIMQPVSASSTIFPRYITATLSDIILITLK